MKQGPLHGLTVIELCQSVAGPYIGMILGDLGCRVIKIERPGTGDDTREWGPPFWNGESPTFLALNRNKESVTLDLKSEAGREALLRMVEKADVFVQNYRAGVLERLGFGYEALRERNPGLVYCGITAFGNQGPLKDAPGYDPLIQAFSGMMSMTGEAGRPPVRTAASVIDQGTGMWSVIGILSALYERRETGRGKCVEISLLETGLAWLPFQIANHLASGQDPRPQGSGMAMIAPYQAFATADGYLIVAAGNDSLWRQFCTAVAHPEWAEDPRFVTNRQRVANRTDLIPLIADVLRTASTAVWEERIGAAGVPCSPIHRLSEALAHPQTEALGIMQPVPHPTVPELRQVGLPLRFNGERPLIRRPPPGLGADTLALMREFQMIDGAE